MIVQVHPWPILTQLISRGCNDCVRELQVITTENSVFVLLLSCSLMSYSRLEIYSLRRRFPKIITHRFWKRKRVKVSVEGRRIQGVSLRKQTYFGSSQAVDRESARRCRSWRWVFMPTLKIYICHFSLPILYMRPS